MMTVPIYGKIKMFLKPPTRYDIMDTYGKRDT